MLQWFRTCARAIAVALFVSLGTVGASCIVPHEDDCHGDACVYPVAPHDPSQHSLEQTQALDEHEFHCLVCHWTRLPRRSADVIRHFVPDSGRQLLAGLDLVQVLPARPVVVLQLRAPPVIQL